MSGWRVSPEDAICFLEQVDLDSKTSTFKLCCTAPPIHARFGGALDMWSEDGRSLRVPFIGDSAVNVDISPSRFQEANCAAEFMMSWSPDLCVDGIVPAVHVDVSHPSTVVSVQQTRNSAVVKLAWEGLHASPVVYSAEVSIPQLFGYRTMIAVLAK